MKFKVVKNQKWLLWADGMVIYPYIVFSVRAPSRRLFKHELEHCYQIQSMGVWGFYSSYILKFLRYGYRKHPYEIEAYEYERESLTDIEEIWFKTGEIDLDNQWLP